MGNYNSNPIEETYSLVFKIDDESLPTVANSSNYRQSAFSVPIQKGVDLACEILNANTKENAARQEDNNHYSKNIKATNRNNVIAFLGERGSGKTSCMLSVVDVLLDKRDAYGEPYRNFIQEFDVIDPTFFDSKHNITDIFIGEFYRKYEELAKDYNRLSDLQRNELKNLQSEFKAVKKALQYLEMDHSEQPLDDIDALSRLSSGVELNRSLSRLVDCYLKFTGRKTLLVVIDDLDLNIEASYRMMEEIRKYLVLPNVIILLGAKLNQLKLGISSSYTKLRDEDLLDKYEIDEMAIRYLDKFVPIPNRIFMPEPENIINTALSVELSDGKRQHFPSVAFAVTSLIYQKTRYLFYNHDGVASMIIPRNLREIRMLVTSLIKRQNPSSEDSGIHKDNKAFFKNYFRTQWIPTLDGDYQDFARGLMEETDITKINKEAIEFLVSTSQAFSDWLSIATDEADDYSSSSLLRLRLRDITNRANANVNITVGDVMATASTIGEFENNHKVARLVFFIQTFYSMKLYELYDEMTAPKNLNDLGIVEKVDTPQTIPVLRNAKNITVPDYLTLAAGDFFVLTGDSFIPFSRTKVSREVRLIDGDVLNENIRKIIDELYDKNKKKWLSASIEQIARLRIIEFFVLCTRRSVTLKKANFSLTKADNWRQNLDPSYLTKLGGTKNILFEVTAPFFNLVYPEFAYRRFNKELYNLALNYEGSLLNLMLKNGRRYEDRNRFADLMSRVCIRNMEVLNDLQKWLAANKDRLRALREDARNLLIVYFNQFSDSHSHYSVKTYDLTADKKSFHKIKFNPLAQLAKALDIESVEGINDTLPLISLFEKIYNPTDKLQDGITYTLKEYSERILEFDSQEAFVLNGLVADIFNTTGKDTMIPQAIINALLGQPPISEDLLKSVFSTELCRKYKDEYLQHRANRIEDLGDSIRLTNHELRSLKRNATEVEHALAKVTETLEEGKNEFKNLSELKLKKSNEATDLQRDMNRLSEEISNLSNHRDSIGRRYAISKLTEKDSTKKPSSEDKKATEELANTLTEIDSRLGRLKLRHEQMESTLGSIKNDIVVIDNDLAVKQSILDKARSEHDHLTGQLNTLNNQINDRQLRKDHLSIRKDQLETEYKDLRRKFRILR